MSDFSRAIFKRIEDRADISVFELNALEKFFCEKLPQYTIRKKEQRTLIVPDNLGAEMGCPINPFTEYEYPQDTYPLLWEAYVSGASGHFATESQWNSINRVCVGEPIMKRKMYGKNVLYFSYEQTKSGEQ